jgi:erythromycin esterase
VTDLNAAAAWLQTNTVRLSAIDPNASLDELEPLRDLIGGARVVALGEGAHFIEEFWTVRQRLVRFLHEQLGFDIVAAEFDVDEAEELDAWLANGADPRPLCSVSPGAFDWGMRGVATWLRAWGASRPQRPRFLGLDLPNGGTAFAATVTRLAAFIRETDTDALPLLVAVEQASAKLVGTSVARTAQAWASIGTHQQEALTASLGRLRLRMRALDAVLVERSSRDRVARARRQLDALIAADYAMRTNEAMLRGADAYLDQSVRDRFLADSVLDLIAREPEARVVVLAHNGHVQRLPVVWGDYVSAHPMGMYLSAALGTDYVVIGTTTTGTVTSEMALAPETDVGFRVIESQLETPLPSSLEAALIAAQAGNQLSLIPCRKAPVGMFSCLRAQSGYLTVDVAAAYDAVISLPKLTVQHDLGF